MKSITVPSTKDEIYVVFTVLTDFRGNDRFSFSNFSVIASTSNPINGGWNRWNTGSIFIGKSNSSSFVVNFLGEKPGTPEGGSSMLYVFLIS